MAPLDRHAAFLHTGPMRWNPLRTLCTLTFVLLSGCSVFQGMSPQPAPGVVTITPTTEGFIALTLPPEYTETPTATIAPTEPPTPTPFTIITVEDQTPEGTETAAIPTPAFTFTSFERFEASRFNIGIDIPNTMRATVLGQNIFIASPSNAEVPIPLTVEMRIDSVNSFRLPQGVNPADPRSVLDGVLKEIEATYDTVSMIRPVTGVGVRSYAAAEAAARTSLGEGDLAENTIWYLAVIVYEETVVRVYASSPADTGGVYLAIAERITDSLEFLSES
jgi:hypothetical protein